ncbi:MAG: class I SAM-dependent methyltransferase, partial [Actinomycetota bacterium]
MGAALTEAGARWAELLASWAIPDDIVARGEVPPWSHDPATFAMDDTADPTSPIFAVARELLPPDGGTVLDVGCGGGRSSLPLSPRARHITGVDSSRAMLDQFASAADRVGVAHREIEGRWPDVAIAAELAGAPIERVDVAVCHHVAFNVPDLEPFVV